MAESVGLAVGERAPDVAAPLVQPDGTVESVALATLAEERPVLLSFYTMDFAPDCVREWCAFRDYEWFASDETVRVVGASRSGPRSHRQFIDKLGLGFGLFADRDLELAESFGVRYRTFGVLARARRSCFLLDEDLEVRYRWIADHWFDPVREVPPMAELAAAIREELDLTGPERFGMESEANGNALGN